MSDLRPSWDPLGYRQPLDHEETFHPLGFPVRIETSSEAVLEAARESWPRQPPRHAPAIAFEVVVSPEGPASAPPTHQARADFFTVVADSRNHAVMDAQGIRIVCWTTAATVADRRSFRRWYLEGPVYQALSQRWCVPIHASCVARESRGLLLCGPPGAGKSSLAFSCAQAGFDFVSDDVVYAVRDQPGIVAGRPNLLRLKPGAEELFPALSALEPSEEPSGELVYELCPKRDLGLNTAAECEAAALVFVESGRTELSAVSQQDAMELLLRELPAAPPLISDAQVRTLRRIAAAPAYRLGVADLISSVAQLEAMSR